MVFSLLVTSFARKTGDIAVLSAADIRVLALCLTLELEENGTWRVRDHPGQILTGPPKENVKNDDDDAATKKEVQDKIESLKIDKEEEEPSTTTTTTTTTAPSSTLKPSPWKTVDPATPTPSTSALDPTPSESTPIPSSPPPPPPSASTSLPASDETLSSPSAPEQGTSKEKEEITPKSEEVDDSRSSSEDTESDDDDDDDDDDEDDDEDSDDSSGSWITPSNIHSHKVKDLGLFSAPTPSTTSTKQQQVVKPKTILKAAVLTGDFAMQNVGLQMGLNVLGSGGKRVKEVRTWVLRCHACFK
jgi:RNA-binding protein NOB1